MSGSPSKQAFIQRGNYPTFAVQWTGEMTEEFRQFITTRGVQDFWVPDVAEGPGQLIIFGGTRYTHIPVGDWLVDQQVAPSHSPFSFVICNNERFHALYREVSPEEHERIVSQQ